MEYPHVLSAISRILNPSNLVSFTPDEENLLKKTGLYFNLYISKMTPEYKKKALQLIDDVKKIDYDAQTSDFYKAQMKVDALVRKFEVEFGLEKRLAQAS